jgi:hypothetical protein
MASFLAGHARVRMSAGARDFALFQNAQNNCEAQPASNSMGTGVRRPGVMVTHTPQFSTEVKKNWSCNSASSICPHDFPFLLRKKIWGNIQGVFENRWLKKYTPLRTKKTTAVREFEVLTATLMKIHVFFDNISREGGGRQKTCIFK